MQDTAKELELAVLDFLSNELGVSVEDGILIAVSGGKDSMALLVLLQRLGYHIQVAHVNFQLRAEESDKDKKLVEQFCEKIGVPFHAVQYKTEGLAEERGNSIQEMARELRYTWFEKIRAENKLAWIATAHHLQDSLETFVLNLSRGAGLKGLLGIPKKRGHIIRPLSNVSPNSILQYINLHAIPYREDASNAKTKYTRNKIRLEILPAFLELPGDQFKVFLETQSTLHQYYKFAQAELEKYKSKYIENIGGRVIINIKAIEKNEHADLLLFEILTKFGFALGQINDMRNAKEGALFYSPQHEACLRNAFLYIQEKKTSQIEAEQLIITSSVSDELKLPEGKLSWRIENAPVDFSKLKNNHIAYLNIDELKFPLILRKWKTGDRFRPIGMNGKSKLLSDYFAENKYTAFEKKDAWLLCSAGEICWLVGRRQAEPFKLVPNSENYLHVIWEPNVL